MNIVVGVVGHRQHGKNTMGDYFVTRGYNRLSFAGPIKDICKQYMGMTDDQLNGSAKEAIDNRWQMTPLDAMQRIGNMFRREISPDFWTRAMRIDGPRTIICDVQFPDEVEMIKKRGGIIVKIVRPGMLSNDSINAHLTIINDGTLDEFKQKIMEAYCAIEVVAAEVISYRAGRDN